MTAKNLTNFESLSASGREASRGKDQYVSPAVDIFETENGLTLVADMPGLDDKSLDISIDKGVLTIGGDATAGTGDFHRREFTLTGYWRQFLLSDSFDVDRAEASVKQGVLTLEIPKAEAAKPKKITVSVH